MAAIACPIRESGFVAGHGFAGANDAASPFPAEVSAFESALQEWELQVTKWETIAEDLLNDAVKRQVLLDQAPQNIKTQLVLAGHESYDDPRGALLSYLV